MRSFITKSCPARAIARRPRRGFTLIEASLATLIVGVGIVATMQLFASCTIENRASAQVSTATMLANNIAEATSGLSFSDPATAHTYFGPEAGETLANYDDVDDFDGLTFNPPIDSQRRQIPEMSQYSQVVSVWPVYPTKLSVNSNEASPDIPKTTYTGALRLKVRVLYRATPKAIATEVYRTSWVRLDNR